MFVSKKEERRLKKRFIDEFLPTMDLSYEEYVAMTKLEKEAVMQEFRKWLRKKRESKTSSA